MTGWTGLPAQDPLGGITRSTYDANGDILTVTDPNGHVTTNTYDIFNHLTATTLAGSTTQFGYDNNGNKISVTDGRGHTTAFVYDGLNRVTSESLPSGGVTHTYNALYETGRNDGVHSLAFGYDVRGRHTSTTWDGGSRTIAYDALSHIVSVTESDRPKATVAYSYDVDGRVVAETSNGVAHQYEYDAAGRRTRVTYSTGRTVQTSYDGVGHVVWQNEGDHITQWNYDAAGQMVGKWLPNDQFEQNAFDNAGRLVDRKLYQALDTAQGTPASLLAEFTWQHDAGGNVTSQTEVWPGAPAQGSRTTAMAYDGLTRLTKETVTASDGVTETDYSYDAAGNRVSLLKSKDGAVQTSTGYTYNGYNQLTGWQETGVSAARSASLAYDAAGNRVSQTLSTSGGSSQSTTYAWDAENRLRGVQTPDGKVYSYGYDYRARRVTRVEPEGNTSVVFSGGLSVAEYATSTSQPLNPPQLKVEYLRGPEIEPTRQPIALAVPTYLRNEIRKAARL